jgi:hypothetical protein
MMSGTADGDMEDYHVGGECITALFLSKKKKLNEFSPQANYSDQVPAACR